MNKEPNLLKFIRFGIYASAFIPLVIFRDFLSPFHFGKVIIFRSLVEVLGAAYLILILKDRSFLPRRDKIFWAFFIFLAAFGLANLASVLKYLSFWGSLERMGGLWTFGHYFLFYVILTSVMIKKEHWQRLLDLLIFTGVLSAFYGFAQKTDISFFLGSGGRERIFGTIGNAALFAGYELFVAFLSLTMFLKFNQMDASWNRRKIAYLFAFTVSSVAVFMTAVRGSLFGYGVGITVFSLLWALNTNSRAGKMAFNALIASAAVFVFFSLVFGDASFVKNSRYLNRVTDLSLSSTTVETRLWAWQAGIKGWIDSPKTAILGWGPETFNIPFSKNFNTNFFVGSGSETLFDRAHNMFVEVLVTMGIIGLLAYLRIFTALFGYLKKLVKNKDFMVYGVGLISALVAYVIHNSFIFDTSANFLVFFTVAGFISFIARAGRTENGVFENENGGTPAPIIKNRQLINLLAVILAVFIPALIYKTNIAPAKANYATTRAIVRGWAGDFSGAMEKYKEALSYNLPGRYEFRQRLAQYLIEAGGAPNSDSQKVKEAYEFAISEMGKNIKENPIDYLPYLYASRLNIILGKNDPASQYNNIALDYSAKALELAPKVIRTYYEIAQAYLNKEEFAKSVEYFQKAVDLNPKVGQSSWYLGIAKIESGDLGGINDLERAQISENAFSPSEKDYLGLIDIYLKSGDFAKIAGIYKILIEKNPTNAQYYASLAVAYANLGRIDDAEAAAREAARIDPSFEPDAREFLKNIGRKY